MEFSYSISEREYAQATKLAFRARRGTIVKTILVWCFIVIGLVIAFDLVSKSALRNAEPVTESESSTVTEPASMGKALVGNFGPLVVVVGGWGIFMIGVMPFLVRKQYKKDTNLHGVITATINRQFFAFRSTTGSSGQSPWSAFKGWREKGGILLLGYPNRTFQILTIGSLSEPERQELRGILAEVLPQKK